MPTLSPKPRARLPEELRGLSPATNLPPPVPILSHGLLPSAPVLGSGDLARSSGGAGAQQEWAAASSLSIRPPASALQLSGVPSSVKFGGSDGSLPGERGRRLPDAAPGKALATASSLGIQSAAQLSGVPGSAKFGVPGSARLDGESCVADAGAVTKIASGSLVAVGSMQDLRPKVPTLQYQPPRLPAASLNLTTPSHPMRMASNPEEGSPVPILRAGASLSFGINSLPGSHVGSHVSIPPASSFRMGVPFSTLSRTSTCSAGLPQPTSLTCSNVRLVPDPTRLHSVDRVPVRTLMPSASTSTSPAKSMPQSAPASSPTLPCAPTPPCPPLPESFKALAATVVASAKPPEPSVKPEVCAASQSVSPANARRSEHVARECSRSLSPDRVRVIKPSELSSIEPQRIVEPFAEDWFRKSDVNVNSFYEYVPNPFEHDDLPSAYITEPTSPVETRRIYPPSAEACVSDPLLAAPAGKTNSVFVERPVPSGHGIFTLPPMEYHHPQPLLVPEDVTPIQVGTRSLPPQILGVRTHQMHMPSKPRTLSEFPYHHPMPSEGCDFILNALPVNSDFDLGLRPGIGDGTFGKSAVGGLFSATLTAFGGAF